MCTLGIDVGTTHVKALLRDHSGRTVAFARQTTPTNHEDVNQATHDAERLWEVVCGTIREALALSPERKVDGVAVASMAEEGFLLDEKGRVLTPGILWYDERTQPLVSSWKADPGDALVHSITGVTPDHIFSALKLQWLFEHDPQLLCRAAHWACVADYVAYRLCDVLAMPRSLACRTMLYDLREARWSDLLLDAAGLPSSIMPDVVDGGHHLGSVTSDAAMATGLASGIPVFAGGHDHLCGCIGAGATGPGDTVHSGGTAEALTRTISGVPVPMDADLSYGSHALPDLFYAARGLHSGAIIAWCGRLTGAEHFEDDLWREATAVPPGSEGLLYVPSWTRTDDGSGQIGSGSLIGLRQSHSGAHILRAVVEGLSFQAVPIHRRLEAASPSPIEAIRVTGGLARSNLWLEVKANVLGVRVDVPAELEATAAGAAQLAAFGSGVYHRPLDAQARPTNSRLSVNPKADIVAAYRRLYSDAYLPAVAAMDRA